VAKTPAGEKALIVFDYIGHAMRGKHVLEQAALKMREVAPPRRIPHRL